MREFICINCPIGCMLTVDDSDLDNIKVTGNNCSRGKAYGISEVLEPRRTVTSSVRVRGGILNMVSVKTKFPIPKNLIFDCLDQLKDIELDAPVKIGDVIIKNVLDTKIDIVATKDIKKRVERKKFILALDQGTTSSRAIIFDYKGEVMGVGQQELPQIYPKPGWVEHKPIDILSSQLGVITEAIIRAGINFDDVATMGITNQRETTIVWNKTTGQPVYNAICWQCRRTEDYCTELKKTAGIDELIYQKTGLRIDAYFSASKIKWILDNVPGAKEESFNGNLLFGTVDTFLMWKLSKGKIFATDYTNASRTLLFNIHTLSWDSELLKLFGIPKSMLPKAHPSSYFYGYAEQSVLGGRISITGVVGDQQGSLFGQLCINKGEVKNTYGTGCFLLMNTGDTPVRSSHGLLTTLAASTCDRPQYALEGSVFIGGATVQWLKNELRMFNKSSESEKYANNCEDSGGVYFVPAFTGLGAPYWDGESRGLITGLTRGTSKEQFIRASLEGIDYQVHDVLRAMESDLGINIKDLAVDGGASKNDFLMQFQANILNTKINRPKVIEVTALGAAYLAGLNIGYWKSIKEIKDNKKIEKTFIPDMDDKMRVKLVHGWHNAVKLATMHFD